ncbi:MAG TPA: zeta toxin family protein [Candidatus Methylacidiphilales bacterium]|jgi:predicted ABC-type ATPase|nr:zeta toxin family protein [Candidatus Methylacidiphilales bacterium]
MPNIYVIAGPNGAGKSTMAARILSRYVDCTEFVNADVIAKDLSASNPESVAIEAGRRMLRRLDELAEQRVDFAFETTLSSRSFAPWLRKRKSEGYLFHLFFAWLPDPAMSVTRVALRVASGGHHVPEADVRRRYERGISNFLELYMGLADMWEVYDNSSTTQLLARGNRLLTPRIYDQHAWEAFKQRRT